MTANARRFSDHEQEQARKLITDAQALADVRTLDEWADAVNTWRHWRCGRSTQQEAYACTLSDMDQKLIEPHRGPTPEAARAKAAAWVREQK